MLLFLHLELREMSGVGNRTLDSMILERLKRAAAGLPREISGPPISELDRLLAQGALTARVAWPRGGLSLFSLVNGLHAEAMLDDSLYATLGGMMRSAETAYFSAVMADIVSGRLIVREPINFLRCNDIPEIQALVTAGEGLEAMAVMVRFAVKNADAKAWLEWHGLNIPDWLIRTNPESTNGFGLAVSQEHPRWSNNLPSSKRARRVQFDAIQDLIESKGYPALAIPHGEITRIARECATAHSEHFDKPTSFENCWKDLNKMGLVRTYNYAAYCSLKASEDKPKP